MPVLNAARLVRDRVDAIRAFHEDIQISKKLPSLPKAELDSSGGIDSAVMACLLYLALGRENVILFHSRINTHESQSARAVALAKALGIPLVDGHFTGVFNAMVGELNRAAVEAGYSQEEIDARCEADPTIMGSIRSTLRAPLGRGINRMLGGGIRHGTGNECEDRFLRFYQKGGDGEVDTNPLAMLSKTEVYQLAFQLSLELPNAPEQFNFELADAAMVLRACIETPPTPDLWDDADKEEPDNRGGHTDEAELLSWLKVPFTYGRVDSETGEILSIGTIERVARFLDTEGKYPDGKVFSIEAALFNGDGSQDEMRALVEEAKYDAAFYDSGLEQDDLLRFLRAARRAEKDTHHKLNPSIPTLGTRDDLVRRGILTNDLTITKES